MGLSLAVTPMAWSAPAGCNRICSGAVARFGATCSKAHVPQAHRTVLQRKKPAALAAGFSLA